jgi:hypothetical protein
MTTEAPDGSTGRDVDDDAPLDLAASAALIEAQRARVVSATDVDGRLLFGLWGAAWLLGFGALWLATVGDSPVRLSIGTALAVFAALILAAMVVTMIHTIGRSAGVSGTSAQQGAMYGWSWSLAFVGVGALGFALERAEAGPVLTSTVMTIVPALLVGALYMAGGAIWRDRTQFALGAWICVVTIAAAVVGSPHMLLVMALAGGGGMLVGGVVEAARRRRRAGR